MQRITLGFGGLRSAGVETFNASATPQSPVAHGARSKALRSWRVRGLVITPTRELAAQLHWAINLHPSKSLHPSKTHPHKSDVIVGTPARLLALMREGTLQVGAVEVLVLDQADRLLHAGFAGDIRKLVRPLPADCQTVLLSRQVPELICQRFTALLSIPACPSPGDTPWRNVIPIESMDALAVLEEIFGDRPDYRRHRYAGG